MNGENYEEDSLESLLLYMEDGSPEEFLPIIATTPQPTENQDVLILENKECIYCSGFYGPCFDEAVCHMCHAFLYPNVAPELDHLTLIPGEGDDSDSGNDEPADDNYHPVTIAADHENGAGDAPAVEVEGLAQHLDRLVIPQHHVDINIDQLPPEILIHAFQFLDDISMWSVGQVNCSWNSIMKMHTNQYYWKKFTLLRWPLLNLAEEIEDWYSLYAALMQSSCCIKCVRQMAARECGNGEECSWRKHRLRTELRTLRTDPPDGIQAKPLDPIYSHWQATIIGPEGSAYEGGTFFLYIQIPYTYPMSPPLVRFITKIFHPNISRHGDIGIDSIHSNWSLALTISKVLISIQSLLTDPVCDVCMEPEIGRLYLTDRNAFEEHARNWTWKHAMHEYLPH